MKRLLVLLTLLATAAVAVPAPASAASSDVRWLCRPGLPDDPCEIALDTTYQSTMGAGKVVTPSRKLASKRPIDCFYVYPTVSNQLLPNASATAEPEIRSIAKYQAARYSTECRVFAPLYRQMSLPGLALGPLGSEKTAYADVLAAWKQYLAQDNRGRGFVLIGHSQGTIMLRRLIREEIDRDPALRKRLVGALLLGGNTLVRKGSTTGGDFRNVPACTKRGQIGCVVAYSTYVNDPPPLSFFGNAQTDLVGVIAGTPASASNQVLCTDPTVLSGSAADLTLTVPSEPFAPGLISGGIALSALGDVPTASTTWVAPPDRFRGSCRTINGATVFRYEPVGPQSRRPLEFPPLWGTHLFDANLGVEKLVSIVHQQSAAYRAR